MWFTTCTLKKGLTKEASQRMEWVKDEMEVGLPGHPNTCDIVLARALHKSHAHDISSQKVRLCLYLNLSKQQQYCIEPFDKKKWYG
eukprot:1161401-Pelagomonas_calceolata.AAC.15